MSNYPDNFNAALFDRTIGGEASPAMDAWEGHAAKLHESIGIAFDTFPVTSSERWMPISAALQKAIAGGKALVDLSRKDDDFIATELLIVKESSDEDSREAVMESAGEIMDTFRRAIENEESQL